MQQSGCNTDALLNMGPPWCFLTLLWTFPWYSEAQLLFISLSIYNNFLLFQSRLPVWNILHCYFLTCTPRFHHPESRVILMSLYPNLTAPKNLCKNFRCSDKNFFTGNRSTYEILKISFPCKFNYLIKKELLQSVF